MTEEIDRSPNRHMRIDVWLWTTRMFKTRNLATQACRGGHVQVDGQRIKAAQKITIGQEVRVRKAGTEFIWKITGFIPTRRQASIAVQCYEDLTPPPDPALRGFVPRRDKGLGRPTKKDRREMEKFLGDLAKPTNRDRKRP
ncbi:MAG: RNA-binding S4 domain-containing protein [Brevibacterium sp.]